MEEIVKQLAAEADKRRAEQIIETQIRVMTASYDKATAYTNL